MCRVGIELTNRSATATAKPKIYSPFPLTERNARLSSENIMAYLSTNSVIKWAIVFSNFSLIISFLNSRSLGFIFHSSLSSSAQPFMLQSASSPARKCAFDIQRLLSHWLWISCPCFMNRCHVILY